MKSLYTFKNLPQIAKYQFISSTTLKNSSQSVSVQLKTEIQSAAQVFAWTNVLACRRDLKSRQDKNLSLQNERTVVSSLIPFVRRIFYEECY